jgi:glucose/arabinose dehydrogenase
MHAHAQNRIGTGAVHELYTSLCASCHGADLKGGLGTPLIDSNEWRSVGKTTSFLDYLKDGNVELGMPAFGEALTDPQIRSLEIYIGEMRQKSDQAELPAEMDNDGVYSAGGYRFKIETIVDGLSTPWSIAFLPTGGAVITERSGSLRMFKDNELRAPVEGTPQVWAHGQGGLLEVAAHPDYKKNAWIYLGYSESRGKEGNKAVGMTKVVRGRIIDNQWMDEEVIFEVPAKYHRSAGPHFGTRFIFQDGFLFFSIGDRGAQDMAQDLSRPNGKIHRVHDDGRIPADNPFVQDPKAYPSIWTYGNRNPQGLDVHPVTGDLWESEHGPRGGDEINLIGKGINYGWPVITYGMNYNGKPITAITEAPGMEQPKHYWTPSIAVCGIDFYEGEAFPDWRYNLFAGGLASKELHRLEVEADAVVSDEIILRDIGRIRDVASGPDGYLYLVLNSPDKVVRLVPAE